MRIIAWNVNHRAARHAIPDWVGTAIAAERPDAVVLTEYVVGPDHGRFTEELRELGLRHQDVTERVGRNNQVLLAT